MANRRDSLLGELDKSSDSDLIKLHSPERPTTAKPLPFGGGAGDSNRNNKERKSGSETEDINLINFKGENVVVYETCGLSSHTVGNIPSGDSTDTYTSPPLSVTSSDDGDDDLISEMKAPHILSASDDGGESESVADEIFPLTDVICSDEEGGLGAEDYYASLFARCDPNKTGRVKVSMLLNTLRDLQALILESDDPNLSVGSSCSGELMQLKEVIDPNNEDPEISLRTFTRGITSYLERRKWSVLSPIKCSSVIDDSEEMCSWPRKSVKFGAGGEPNSSFLDLSCISSSQNYSLEALAGTSSSLMDNGEPDLIAEISDLQLQIQKLNDDNGVLKHRVSAAQDENFNLLQFQRDELDRKDMELKAVNERIKRLERELNDKNQQISSLEDRNTVLCNRNTRLENECSAYQKERKELMLESEELQGECKKGLRIIANKDEEIEKMKACYTVAGKEWEDKVRWLNERNERINQKVEGLTQTIQTLELDKSELEGKLVMLHKPEPSHNHHHVQSPTIYHSAHADSFDLDVSQDIFAELLAAEGRFLMAEEKSWPERFDVATQLDSNEVDEEDIVLLSSLAAEITDMLLSLHQITLPSSSSTATDDELCKVDQMPNGSGGSESSVLKKSKKKRKCKGDSQAEGGDNAGAKDSEQLSESNATAVVRQINEELTEFREQLKKSQELFAVLRYNSCQSITLTKSCPGLTLDPGDALSKSCSTTNNKNVSCGTQTDSPVIETPILAQKLSLRSSSLSAQHQHHHHLLMNGGDLVDFMSNDSMDNPSFDKLSDDGSVRVRDDLSMVLEVSEQETETSPGPGRRTMSMDKGNRRNKLTRMPNATEEEPNCSSSNSHHNSSRASNSHHLNVEEGHRSDNDFVSATSSQAESVYLSLERPLKVTVSSKEDRSSGGNYRSCASSISGGYRSLRSGDGPNAPDCDTASLVSEGNTTFGSPLSSPSSPYWTPSQGSSSQETITDGDGDKTPVNDDQHHPQYHSDREIDSDSRHRFKSSPSRSEPSSLRIGVIPQSEMEGMMRLIYDPVGRATNDNGQLLSNSKEWKQLRIDKDSSDKDTYRKTYQQEEGNEDDRSAGMDGGPSHSLSAFASDEEAEKYLELFPKLAESLFKVFDREPQQMPTKEDLEDLELKFNHMAEVFQTDHINLEQRKCALSKDIDESQVNLKEISQSLKSSVSRLKELSKSNSIVPEDVLEVMKTLNNTSDEFELYSSSMWRNSRRLGMMDVHNRLHKMVNVMILYVHIVRTKYNNLQEEFTKATKLLSDKNITFTLSRPLDSPNNNNNDEKCAWDEDELDNSHSDRYEDGDSESEKILQHYLLGPKKSSSGLHRKDRPIFSENRSSDNVLVRYIAEGYEVLRREFFWPWNLEQTIKGLKQGFSVILMILGLFVFLRGFLPSVSAIDDGCMTNPSFYKSVGAYFSYCGDLSHDDAPVI